MEKKKYFAPLTLMACPAPHSYKFIERILDAVDSLRSEFWFYYHGFDISNSIYFVNSEHNLDLIKCFDV